MNKYKKYTKNEIDMLKKHIKLKKSKGHKDEEIKQIYLNNDYIPYLISSYGRVFSVNYKHQINNVTELKYIVDKDGYIRIVINYNSKVYSSGLHNLVALHYIKNNNINKRTQVNHKDGIKSHNFYWNLEWVTCKENIHHAWENNLAHSLGEDNGNNIYKESDIIKVCELLVKNLSFTEISKKTGVSYAMISLIFRRKFWTHISSKYDFSNYDYGKSNNKEVIKICELLQNTDLSVPKIAKLCSVNKTKVYDILKRKNYKKISKKYDFSNRINKA